MTTTAPPDTYDATTVQLKPGDRVWLPFLGGHVRTIARVYPNGTVSRSGAPLYNVEYDTAELADDAPFRANSDLGNGAWQVIR